MSDGYLAYLPPVLWPGDRPPLGDLLRGFEKILTGIDDGFPVPHGTHDHRAIGEVIARVADLFSPQWTAAEHLPWLASWVGLTLQSGWDERQRRAAIAGIVGIHALRGTKEGLARYLDLYAGAATRQRIVIDNGAKLLFLPRTGGPHTLLSHGAHLLPNHDLAYSGLVSPQCLALAPDGLLIVGDAGGPGDKPPPPGVWRITRAGDYADLTPSPQRTPAPIGPPNWPPANPVCLATRGTAAAWELFVLDAELRVFRVSSANLVAAQRVQLTPPLSVDPAGMTFASNGHLLVLDRGGVIVDIDLSVTPATATARAVSGLAQPRSIVVTRAGTLLVADARDRDAPTPADVLRVTATSPTQWAATSLLGALPEGANPLVAPYAMAEDQDGTLLVADAGLRPDRTGTEPFLRTVIEPAAIYRVRLGDTPSVSAPLGRGRLVFPRGIVAQDGVAYLCDGGEPNDAAVVAGDRNFRMAPHEFGVIVHFDKDNTSAEYQRTVVRGVAEIVDRERPAGALPTQLDAIGAG